VTTSTETAFHTAVEAAAAALRGKLPVAVDPAPADDRPEALVAPGEGSMALAAGIAGGDGATIVLALAPELVAAIVEGPLGEQDLAGALVPALEDALRALEPAVGTGLALDAPQVVPADLALESLGRSGSPTFAVALQTAAGTGALLVLGAPMPELALEPILGDVDGGAGPLREVDPSSLELLSDVEMAVTAVLGRTRLSVRHLLGLAVGHVVELDRTADSAVDLLVNGTLVARGEVVVIDDEFGVRVTEIVGRRDRAPR
jgi:flagellar motor switch protein FliN/FliY